MAQIGVLNGKVTDGKNLPLEGVSVTIKGTKKGVTTNAQGTFVLKNIDDNATLVFSFTGFINKEVPLRGNTGNLVVRLEEQALQLNDVVVIGYGTQTKKDLTGAVAQVKASQLENENPRSVQDMLRGNVPGLDVSFDPSTKGGSAKLLVRGKGSLTAQPDPVIVLDGVIFSGGMEDINPNDIATIDILKDASSAAVFGARAANGVILITTKRGSGKNHKPTITFNDNIGINVLEQKPHLLNGYEMINFRQDYEAAAKYWFIPGLAPTVGGIKFDSVSTPGIQYYYKDPRNNPGGLSTAQWMALRPGSAGDPVVEWLNRNEFKPIEISNIMTGKMLNWEDLIYNKSALQHDHTVSMMGRRDDFNYYMSLGYLSNQGLTVGDQYKVFRTRVNLEGQAAKFLTVGLNLQYSNRDESSVPVSMSDVQQTTPWGSYYADDGVTLRLSPNDDPGNNTHPFMEQAYTTRMKKFDNFFASLYAKGKLPFGFSYQVNFTPRYENSRYFNFRSPQNPTISARNGIAVRGRSTIYQWQLDNIIRWNQKFGKHSIEATFLINAEKFQSWSDTTNAENFSPNANLGYHNLGGAAITTTITDDQYATGDALMGRIAYNYDQRYFLTATARRDGYSAFGQENPRATFPSLALSWVFSQEKFMHRFDKWLDYAKLRVSYGENGNREIGRYAAMSALNASKYVYITPSGTVYDVATLTTNNMSNAGLKWERNRSVNVGIDYSILRGRISGSLDYYQRTTKDLLVNRSLPSVTGFVNVLSNLGEVQNNGFELSVSTLNMDRRNFTWRSTLSFWVNKNKILHLYGPVPVVDANGKTSYVEKDDIKNGWFIGKDINAVYDYRVTGVWQVADSATARSYGYKPGDFRLQDTNGDGKYTVDDKQFLGSTTPDFSWNLRNEFRVFRNFDVSLTLYSKVGQLSQLNEAKNVDKFYNRSNFYLRPYWTPTNPINDYAAINSNAAGAVTWNVYRKSSFIRISNISVAYNLPSELAHRYKMEAVKVYINAVNPQVFSSWSYYDPENKGITPITFNFGLNITL
jgi:TonB-linked SusC/RagA family outer membrane protein